jgi:hypothetical protein
MTDSKQNYVPVAATLAKGGRRGAKRGTLQGSGHVEEPVIEGGAVSVRLAYGGPAEAYAIAIHEHLSQFSPPSWRKAEMGGAHTTFGRLVGSGVHFAQGGPKYLELPYLAGIKGLADWIGEQIRQRLGT